MIPPLRDYQQKALDALHAGYKLLALEQGLGKTRVMIEFAKQEKAKRILIFCPSSVRLVWADELVKWWPEKDRPPAYIVTKPDLFHKNGIFIVSFDFMSRGDSFVNEIKSSASLFGAFDLALVDECHALKNHGSNRTKAIYGEVRKYVKGMIAASGTPAPNHYGELYTAFKALAPEKICLAPDKPMARMQFEDMFCQVEDKWFGGRCIRTITGSKNGDLLRKKLVGFLLRMTKKEVLPDLPPLDFIKVPIEPTLTGVDKDILVHFDRLFEECVDDEAVLVALQSKTEHIAKLRSALGLAKTNSAVEYLIDFLGDDPAKAPKIVVWAEHHVVIDTLMIRLADYMPARIDGRSSPAERAAAVRSFLEDKRCRVFIGNIKAAGTGLTLIGPNCQCSDAFFVESSYTPGDNLQAAARIHRLGQRDGVLARVFTARRTIDDRIQAIIARKTNELAEIFG